MKKAGASYLLPPPTQLQAGLFLHFKAKHFSMLRVNPFTIFGDKSGKNQLTDLSCCIFILSHSKSSFLRTNYRMAAPLPTRSIKARQ